MDAPAQALTDAELLHHTRAGDAAAYDELGRRHVSEARRVARTIANDHGEADQAVADAFARLRADILDGHGPSQFVAPHMRAIIRRLVLDRHRPGAGPAQPPPQNMAHPAAVDPVAEDSEDRFADPNSVEDLPTVVDRVDVSDRNVFRDAFETLPERWQRALWMTVIEGRRPHALTPTIASTPDAAAALAFRAQQGIQQATLAVLLTNASVDGCGAYVAKLPGYIRESLTPEDDVAVAVHLDLCSACRVRRYELVTLFANLRGVLAPALLGYSTGESAIAGPLPGATPVAAAPPRRLPRPRRVLHIVATTVVSAAAAALVAYAAFSAIEGPTTPIDAASAADTRAFGTVHTPAKEQLPAAVTATPIVTGEDGSDVTEAAGMGAVPTGGADPQPADSAGASQPGSGGAGAATGANRAGGNSASAAATNQLNDGNAADPGSSEPASAPRAPAEPESPGQDTTPDTTNQPPPASGGSSSEPSPSQPAENPGTGSGDPGGSANDPEPEDPPPGVLCVPLLRPLLPWCT